MRTFSHHALRTNAPVGRSSPTHDATSQTYRMESGERAASDLSDNFPQLEALKLYSEASLEWLPVFGAAARHTSPGLGTLAPSSRGPGQRFTALAYNIRVSVSTSFNVPHYDVSWVGHPCASVVLFEHGWVCVRLDIAGIVLMALLNLEDPRLHDERVLPRCRLTQLSVTFSSLGGLWSGIEWSFPHFPITLQDLRGYHGLGYTQFEAVR